MSCAVRSFVPLNRRCSRKWDAPDRFGRSSRDPTSTQKPNAMDRMVGISSLTMRRPEEYSLRVIVERRRLARACCRARVAADVRERLAAGLNAPAARRRRGRVRTYLLARGHLRVGPGHGTRRAGTGPEGP